MAKIQITVGTVRIQGRDLEIARFTSHDAETAEPLEENEEEGFMAEMNRALTKAAARIDVTPEGEESRFVIVEYGKTGTLDPVSAEELEEFLAPFHIGPDRETYVPGADNEIQDTLELPSEIEELEEEPIEEVEAPTGD